MTDKSYQITISLLRISLLAGQIAVSPSAVAAAARQQPALGACPAFVASMGFGIIGLMSGLTSGCSKASKRLVGKIIPD
jgi:hypothetical protein